MKWKHRIIVTIPKGEDDIDYAVNLYISGDDKTDEVDLIDAEVAVYYPRSTMNFLPLKPETDIGKELQKQIKFWWDDHCSEVWDSL